MSEYAASNGHPLIVGVVLTYLALACFPVLRAPFTVIDTVRGGLPSIASKLLSWFTPKQNTTSGGLTADDVAKIVAEALKGKQ